MLCRYERSNGMLQPVLLPADDSLPQPLLAGAASIGVTTGSDTDLGVSSIGGAQQQYMAGGSIGAVGGSRRGGALGGPLLQPHVWVGCTARRSSPEVREHWNRVDILQACMVYVLGHAKLLDTFAGGVPVLLHLINCCHLMTHLCCTAWCCAGHARSSCWWWALPYGSTWDGK
jgi:hypothetical protein